MLTQTATAPSFSSVLSRAQKAQSNITKTSKLNRVYLQNLILSQNGKFVSVRFEKLNGDTRTLVGRLGVKKFLKGGQNKVEAMDRPYLTIFDIKLMKYRTINLATITEIRAQNHVYSIVG